MARILAVTWDGGGNVPPLLGITARLRERGHTVRVLGHDTQRATVEATGAEFVAHRHARAWSATAPVPHRQATATAGARIRRTDGAAAAADEIEGLLSRPRRDAVPGRSHP